MWWVSGDTIKIVEFWPPSLDSLVEVLNRHRDVEIALTYSIPCSAILGRTYGEEMNALKSAIQSNPRIVSVDFYTDPKKVQTTTLELAEAIFAFLSLGAMIFEEKFNGLRITDPPTLSLEARKVIAVAETDRDSILDAVVEALSTGAKRVEAGQKDILILMGEFDTFVGPVHVMSRSIEDIVGGITPEDDKTDVPVDNPLPLPESRPSKQRRAKTVMALNMREAPRSSSKKVTVVPKGATIEVRDPDDVTNYYTYVGFKDSYGAIYFGHIAVMVNGTKTLEYESE